MIRLTTLPLLCLCALLLTSSCSDKEEPAVVPTLEVNYYNLSGNWQMKSWNNHPLPQDAYLYISFDRRKHTYEMHDKTDSMYDHVTTGTYLLTKDEKTGSTILSGLYDYGMGEWANSYTVTILTATTLQLTATTQPTETRLLIKVENLPTWE